MRFLAALIPMLANMLATLAGRIFAALGLSVVSYVGLDLLVGRFKSAISAAVSGVPKGLLQMFYLSGGGVVLNIMFGCLSFVAAFKALSRIVPTGSKKN